MGVCPALGQASVRAAQKHEEAYHNDEEMLLGFAADMAVWNLSNAVKHWSCVADDIAGPTPSSNE